MPILPRRPMRHGAFTAVTVLLAATVFQAVGSAADGPAAPLSPEEAAGQLGYDLTQPLTRDQCIAVALQVHPDVTIAVADLQAALAGLREARASLWPSFVASSDYRVTQQPTRTVQVGGTVFPAGGGRSTVRNSQVTGSYSIYQSGRDETIARAKSYADAARAGLDDARRQLVYLITRSYYDTLAADRLVTVQEQSLAVAEGGVEMVQAEIDAEDAAPVEIHAVRSQLHATQLQLVSARNQAAIARATLRSGLGEPQTEIVLADDWREPTSLPMLDECIETALADRPDLAQNQAAVRAAKLGVRIARVARRPQLNVLAQGEYGRFDGLTGSSWTVYGTVRQNIFDGGATEAGVERARADLWAAEAQLLRGERSVRLQVETAWLNLRESVERIATAEAGRVEAQANLDAAQQRYAANVGILLEVTDAQARATRAEVDLVQANYEYNIALADLWQAMGASIADLQTD